MTGPRYVDIENDCLREGLKQLRAAARDLALSGEKYLRQEVLRSALYAKLTNLKKALSR